jgi:hypothetical protein
MSDTEQTKVETAEPEPADVVYREKIKKRVKKEKVYGVAELEKKQQQKKVRSPAQIAAFKKCQEKRREKLALKKVS